MKSNYKKLGAYIKQVDNRNTDSINSYLRGVSSVYKCLMQSKANLVGTDMSTYKLVRKNQFVFNPNTARMGDKIPIALNDSEDCIVSQIYPVFEILNHNKLSPEYLMMWFKRLEFDRYARFKSHGSAREIFDWEQMCEVELPIPNINKQREIVKEYNVLVDRINLNNQFIKKLEETVQALYKQWFVDFEFPNENGKPYRSNSGEMEFNEELEKNIPKGWAVGFFGDNKLTEIIKPGIKKFDSNKLFLATSGIKGSFITDYNTNITYLNRPSRANMQPTENSIWFAKMKNTKKVQIFLDIDKWSLENIILSTGFVGIKPLQSSVFYIWALVNSNIFNEEKDSFASGTTMEAINNESLKSIKYLIPSNELMEEFNKIMTPILRLSSYFKNEIKELTQTKELLLSKLATINN